MKKRKKRVRVDEAFTQRKSIDDLARGPRDETQSKALKRLHEKRMAVYQKQVERVGERLLHAALRAYASYDAAIKVNEKLAEQFGMGENSGVDLPTVEAVLRQTLRAEIARILVNTTSLAQRDRDAMTDRIIARMLPIADSPPQAVQPSLQKKDLERIVREEGKRITKAVAPRPAVPAQRVTRPVEEKKPRPNGNPLL